MGAARANLGLSLGGGACGARTCLGASETTRLAAFMRSLGTV